MAKKKKPQGSITNKRARFDYDLDEEFIVGIQLTGAETKALRKSQGHIRGAYVTIKNGELWLINSTITGDARIRIPEEDHTRSRKLLAKRREIDQLISAKQNGQTILPIEIHNKKRYIKLKIASGRGKRKYDKRQSIKKRDEDRRIRQITR